MFQSPPTRAKIIHFWVTAENLPSPVWSAGNIPHMRIKSNCPVWVGIFGPYQSSSAVPKGEIRPTSARSATKNMAPFLRLAKWTGLSFQKTSGTGTDNTCGKQNTFTLLCGPPCEHMWILHTDSYFPIESVTARSPPHPGLPVAMSSAVGGIDLTTEVSHLSGISRTITCPACRGHLVHEMWIHQPKHEFSMGFTPSKQGFCHGHLLGI